MATARELAITVGPTRAAAAFALPRASFYRAQRPGATLPMAPRPTPPRALSAAPRQEVLEALHSERFVD